MSKNNSTQTNFSLQFDWNQSPSWAIGIAFDDDGNGYWHERKPEKTNGEWYNADGLGGRIRIAFDLKQACKHFIPRPKFRVLVIEHDGYNDWVSNQGDIIEVDAFTPSEVARVYFNETDPSKVIAYFHQAGDRVITNFGEESGTTFVLVG